MERGLRYEVERVREGGINEVVLLFLNLGSLLKFFFVLYFFRLCSLSRFLVYFHFGYSFSVSLINKISTILRTRKDLGEFVFSFGPRTGQARRGSPLFPALDMDGHQ